MNIEHCACVYGPPGQAAQKLPKKQITILKQIRQDVEYNEDIMSIHKVITCSYSTLRKMRDRGLIYMFTGGPHGGSHSGYLELTSYGVSVVNFL